MISSGALYCNGEPLGEVKELEIELTEEMFFPKKERVEVELKLKATNNLKKWRKLLGYISQKRFRKLLYSIGYQRNQVNEIIEIEWGCKRSYNIEDIKFWKEYLKCDIK